MPRGVETRKAGEPFELHAELDRRRMKCEPPPAAALPDGVQRCARCGGTHSTMITALPLTKPVVWGRDAIATHWFSCPANGQPVMVLVFPGEVRAERGFVAGPEGVLR